MIKMKALSLNHAYLAGVIVGDGYCTSKTLGILAKDKDFVETFQSAIKNGFGTKLKITTSNGYWRIVSSNKSGRYNLLINYKCKTDREKVEWLRGLFDSEGNVQLLRMKRISENSYCRRIAIYSTNRKTLNKASVYLNILKIKNNIKPIKSSEGHLGKKQVYELKIIGGRENYIKFGNIISSSIRRKRDILNSFEDSYRPNNDYLKLAQTKGAMVKRKRTIEITIPLVLKKLKKLNKSGKKLTERYCSKEVSGYNTIYSYFGTHSSIIDTALERI